jgi:large subunit ribosomal protein L23
MATKLRVEHGGVEAPVGAVPSVHRVLDEAHKVEIRQAVEELFDVTVTDVRIVKVQPKPKRRGRTAGTRGGWKKAIVELQPGDSIDIFEGA